ncbi:terminase TerL endonuclease subunit [Algoriphagus sp. D3-2-R+10]|uniref:terminase large subunit n=1 Tax=Algoriphagus aurantiacus TaxID=3103948 RepID=UPI002B3EEA08|nr:terminase TerL endonuclease subunit [Algoriphagus sp. D3-2-R+10]MEB2775222.1 terminase TerL endonuclease subunit [Algoriphagus sp. D3-2-R+10]
MNNYTVDFSRIDLTKYYYDKEEAERAIRFIELYCKIVDGNKAGQPLLLLDWQKELIRALFGYKHISTGFRKYRQVNLLIPRKNGKTVFSVAILLYVLLCDNEEFAQCYFAGADREQARLAIDVLKAMVSKQPKFQKVLKVLLNSVSYRKTNSFVKVISSDANTKHGYNTHFALIDELHAHQSDELYQVLSTSVGSRSQPIIFTISTSGSDKNHICYELYDYSKKIIEGVIEDETFLPFIFEGNPELPIDDLENLKLANPSIGVGVSLEYLLTAANKAKAIPTQLEAFKQLHLNLWVDAATAFIKSAQWDVLKAEYTDEDLEGEECFMSYDFSANKDLTSINLLFPPTETRKKFRTLSYNFLPMDAAIEKSNISAGRVFLHWGDDPKNNLFLTIKKTTDFDFVLEKIIEINEKFKIKQITYDRFLGNYMNHEISKIVDCELVEFNQNFRSFSPATKELENMVLERTLEHNDNKVLSWCISNVKVLQDNHENIKPIKSKSSDKIDSAIALLMNVGQYLNSLTEPDENEYYDGIGFIMV